MRNESSPACTTSSPRLSRRNVCEHALHYWGCQYELGVALVRGGLSHGVYVRHEHCALAAAMAYSRKNWDVGVATVTCGPGVTQTIMALPAAVRAHLPLVVFAGEAPLKSGWYNQEIEQAPLIAATGAAYHSLHMPERMPVAVRDAFLQARRERRPVVIGIPFICRPGLGTGLRTCPRPRTNCCRGLRRFRRIDDVAGAAQLAAALNGSSCWPVWARLKPARNRLPGVGGQDRWTAVYDASCERAVPR